MATLIDGIRISLLVRSSLRRRYNLRILSTLCYRDSSARWSAAPGDEGKHRVHEAVSAVTSLLRRNFPGTAVYPVLGGADVWPRGQTPLTSAHAYQDLANLWRIWLPPEAESTFRKGKDTNFRLWLHVRLCSSLTVGWRTRRCRGHSVSSYHFRTLSLGSAKNPAQVCACFFLLGGSPFHWADNALIVMKAVGGIEGP